MRKILIVTLLMTFLAACTDTVDPTADPPFDATVVAPHPDAGSPDATVTHCGELGEACCAEGLGCNGGAHADIYCSTGGVCMAPVPNCGGAGQACCNPLCGPDGGCWTAPCEGSQECQAGTCTILVVTGCGGEDEACCKHAGTEITFCATGLECDGEAADGTRTCI